MRGNESINLITQENYKNLYGEGLTKREYFAGLAMQSIIASGRYSELETACCAINYADELLKQLELELGL